MHAVKRAWRHPASTTMDDVDFQQLNDSTRLYFESLHLLRDMFHAFRRSTSNSIVTAQCIALVFQRNLVSTPTAAAAPSSDMARAAEVVARLHTLAQAAPSQQQQQHASSVALLASGATYSEQDWPVPASTAASGEHYTMSRGEGGEGGGGGGWGSTTDLGSASSGSSSGSSSSWLSTANAAVSSSGKSMAAGFTAMSTALSSWTAPVTHALTSSLSSSSSSSSADDAGNTDSASGSAWSSTLAQQHAWTAPQYDLLDRWIRKFDEETRRFPPLIERLRERERERTEVDYYREKVNELSTEMNEANMRRAREMQEERETNGRWTTRVRHALSWPHVRTTLGASDEFDRYHRNRRKLSACQDRFQMSTQQLRSEMFELVQRKNELLRSALFDFVQCEANVVEPWNAVAQHAKAELHASSSSRVAQALPHQQQVQHQQMQQPQQQVQQPQYHSTLLMQRPLTQGGVEATRPIASPSMQAHREEPHAHAIEQRQQGTPITDRTISEPSAESHANEPTRIRQVVTSSDDAETERGGPAGGGGGGTGGNDNCDEWIEPVIVPDGVRSASAAGGPSSQQTHTFRFEDAEERAERAEPEPHAYAGPRRVVA